MMAGLMLGGLVLSCSAYAGEQESDRDVEAEDHGEQGESDVRFVHDIHRAAFAAGLECPERYAAMR
jgi:hypothetical protein